MTRVLIAEDDPVMTRLLQFNLQRAGFEVVACADGFEVEARARAVKPAVALFDFNLPGKTGLELARAFQGDAQLCRIPLVVVTGQGKDAVFRELLAEGVQEVFTKPYSPTVLVETVRRLVQENPRVWEENPT